MKNIYKILTAIVLITIVPSCNEDFLDRFPQDRIGVENFFNTEAELALYANNLYNFPGFGIYYNDAGTDNQSTTGNLEIKTMMIGAPDATTVTGGWNWGNLRTINIFLDNMGGADVADHILKHYEGVGRFFRARFYINMVKRYSDVPWYENKLTSSSDDLFKPRDSRSMVVDNIMADLQFAADNISENSQSGVLNNMVAKAYLARYALYEGTFRKYHDELSLTASADQFLQMARDVSKEIMDDGGYSIYNTGNPDSDYGTMFNSAVLNSNSEVILGTFSEFERRNSDWSETVFGNYENSPAKDLVQAYLMDDGSYYSAQTNFETNQFVEEFTGRDPRLSQTFAAPGFELIYSGTYAQFPGLYVQQLLKNFTGYHQVKGFVNSIDPATQADRDVPVLRFAETLLIYAEARAELGELTQGDLDMTVNDLRDRAGMPSMTMAPAIDAVQDTRYPNVSGQKAEILEIRRERRVELALEGYRHDDIMRWKAGKLLEAEPVGLYFPGLGNYDLNGDSEDDIKLIDVSESVPAIKEQNGLGVDLLYYKAGAVGTAAGVFLENGTSGNVVSIVERGTFVEPKYYYRPVPQTQVVLNPSLIQIFGWN